MNNNKQHPEERNKPETSKRCPCGNEKWGLLLFAILESFANFLELEKRRRKKSDDDIDTILHLTELL